LAEGVKISPEWRTITGCCELSSFQTFHADF
jgi:hypothetical protein